MEKKKVIAVSGAFDPVHADHIKLFKKAKELGDELVVILNTDEWIKRKRGFVFMPFEQRKEILESIRYVDRVVKQIDKDESIAETLRLIKPDIFAKSGDRTLDKIPQKEKDVCRDLGIQLLYVDTGEIRVHSSWLLQRVKNEYQTKIEKPWGYEEILQSTSTLLVKKLFIRAGETTSLHYHKQRTEFLIAVEGKGAVSFGGSIVPLEAWAYPSNFVVVEPNVLHRIFADTDLTVIEVSNYVMNDVIRVEDRYGRV